MARLIVKLRGEEVAKLTLESGHEYVAGRAADAQIVLNGERGISRHHLKFIERSGEWTCESLSKFVLIQKGASEVESLGLTEATTFSVTPYEFHFEPTLSEAPGEDAPAPSDHLPAAYVPRVTPAVASSSPLSEHTAPHANNEATQAGMVSVLVPYICVSYPNTADDEVLKLEGHLWVAGRDPNCEIPIESPHISRKHFELVRTKEGFFITDLGSSNGTRLNGQRIPPHEPTRLESGDELAVKNVEMRFEIRDTGFAQRLDRLPVPSAFHPGFAGPPQPWYPPEAQAETELRDSREKFPARLADFRLRHLRMVEPKKLIIRGALLVLIPVIAVLAVMPDKPKPAPRDPANNGGDKSLSFGKLTPEQQTGVKDSFNLARNLYVQGKYDLCLAELIKLKELIPQYENSTELQSFCEQGRELVHRQKDLERKERERQMIEQQISGIVENCRNKLPEDSTVDDTRQCLAEAMELDPEHHLIIEMINTAQTREADRKFLNARRDEADRKARRGQAQYKAAHEYYSKGDLRKALNAYQSFVETPFPHSEENKNAARRDIASIKKEIKTKVDSLVDQCKSAGTKGKFKEAYAVCEKALREDPDNSVAREVRDQMVSELKREMKGIYEDSVLEESLGNVDSAKEKWKKIVKEDLDGGEYANKSKYKLQKYGVGM